MGALYVHIPFCEHKCVYCDFYSIAPDEEKTDGVELQAAFTESVLREISLRRPHEPLAEPFDTIFFGGGTPSLLERDQAGSILDALYASFPVEEDAECTLEANPGTVSKEKLAIFRAMGFNRISLGVQSFHEDELRFLTRIHSVEQAEKSVREARDAGFEDLNIDLIFGLPGQTVEKWNHTLTRAIGLAPDHISCYSLTVETNTPLARMVSTGSVRMLDRTTDAQLYERTIEQLESHGFVQYEVSNFSRPGRHSRHNLNYWSHGDYLGFGPSAHSFVGGLRSWNIANLSTYTQQLTKGERPIDGEEMLTEEQLRTERIFLGLRSSGIDLERYEEQFGVSFLEERHEKLEPLLRDGLAHVQGSFLSLSRRGYMICDEICALLT
jgi:oxygen-independent coproporphyrinogen-3 oxidase